MRMQQRRQNAATWTASNDVLLQGELGVELDTGKWKVGDGATGWTGLAYQPSNSGITAAINSAITNLVNGAPAAVDTLKELADALGDDPNFATTVTTALAAKAPLASPTFTGTVAGISKSMVGLGSVDNTADAAKPVSTAQATADSAVQAYAVQRGNHTGTQPASTVTGLAAVATTGAKADVGLSNVDNTSDVNKPVSTATSTALAAKANVTDVTTGNLFTTGQETFPRLWITGSATTGSGSVRLTYFTARRTETITQVRFSTSSTAAAATPTLQRIGLYSVAANGNLTLVASTVSDTTLAAAASTSYTKAFSASYQLTVGSRYAVGYLLVTAATAPTLAGIAVLGSSAEFAADPRTHGIVASQSDLPASVTAAGVTNGASLPYFVLLP